MKKHKIKILFQRKLAVRKKNVTSFCYFIRTKFNSPSWKKLVEVLNDAFGIAFQASNKIKLLLLNFVLRFGPPGTFLRINNG